MRMIECIHTQSNCYGSGRKSAKPIGIVVHSTGANNVYVKRYTQPSDNDPNRAKLLQTLGTNTYGNHWNRPGVSKAVHYFIGKLADGTVATIHNLPEDIACWGAGKGKYGSYNYDPTAHIQFEVCEDNLKDANYFNAIYKEATELCADICKRHGWTANVIVSHREAHAKGYASNHSDIDHWLSWHGKTMNDFRNTVTELLKPKVVPVEPAVVFEVGDRVKIKSGVTTYANGKTMASWVPSKLLYVRKLVGTDRAQISTVPTGSITGTVFTKDLVLVEKVKKETTTTTTTTTTKPTIKEPTNTTTTKPQTATKPVVISKGDKVKLVPGSKWYNGKSIASWLFAKTLYVRQIQQKAGKTVYLLSTHKTLPVYSGRAHINAIKKV